MRLCQTSGSEAERLNVPVVFSLKNRLDTPPRPLSRSLRGSDPPAKAREASAKTVIDFMFMHLDLAKGGLSGPQASVATTSQKIWRRYQCRGQALHRLHGRSGDVTLTSVRRPQLDVVPGQNQPAPLQFRADAFRKILRSASLRSDFSAVRQPQV